MGEGENCKLWIKYTNLKLERMTMRSNVTRNWFTVFKMTTMGHPVYIEKLFCRHSRFKILL